MMNNKMKYFVLVGSIGLSVSIIDVLFPDVLIFIAFLFGLLILPVLGILSIIVIGASKVVRKIRETSKSTMESIVISV